MIFVYSAIMNISYLMVYALNTIVLVIVNSILMILRIAVWNASRTMFYLMLFQSASLLILYWIVNSIWVLISVNSVILNMYWMVMEQNVFKILKIKIVCK